MEAYEFGSISLEISNPVIVINVEQNKTFLPKTIPSENTEKIVFNMDDREYDLITRILSSMVRQRIKKMENPVKYLDTSLYSQVVL